MLPNLAIKRFFIHSGYKYCNKVCVEIEVRHRC